MRPLRVEQAVADAPLPNLVPCLKTLPRAGFNRWRNEPPRDTKIAVLPQCSADGSAVDGGLSGVAAGLRRCRILHAASILRVSRALNPEPLSVFSTNDGACSQMREFRTAVVGYGVSP